MSFGWGKSSVSQVHGDSDSAPPVPADCGGEGLSKGTMPAASTLVPERAVSLALALKPDNLVLLQMYLLWSLGKVFVSE